MFGSTRHALGRGLAPGRGLRRSLPADGSRGVRLRTTRPKAHSRRREPGYAALVQDEIYKKLFAFPRMVEDLMRGFAARGWAVTIDFSTLRKLPAEFVSDELLKRHGDTVWVARLRDGRHLLMVLEFQSRDDPGMALRILAYTSLLYQELLRNEAPVLDPGRRLPLVLPVVLYNGETPWRAANRLAALIQPAGRALVPYQPSQSHYVLDERHASEDDFPRQNLVTAMLHVERIDSPSDLVAAVDVLREWFRCPEDDDLRRAFTDWVRRIAQRLVPGGEKLAAQMTLEDMRMTVVERVSEWPKQWVREGREQGMREGLRQGIEQGIERGRAEERALLARMAASRFGAEAAERLSAVLAEVSDPERLGEVGEWLVRCDTAEELLARVSIVRTGG
ncbi:MAG: transposase [Proteobacteria bacterium]|nr:transposase [Pseudomonadota bacterium]